MDTLFDTLTIVLDVTLVLLGLWCWAKVVRQAFKGGPLAGVAAAFFPPFTLWYMFMRYEHDLKLIVVGTAMLGLWVAASVALVPRMGMG